MNATYRAIELSGPGKFSEVRKPAKQRLTILQSLLMTVAPSSISVSLESNTGTNIYSLAPNNLALKSVSIMSWFRLAKHEKRKDFELALSLAINHAELFEVAPEYEFGDFQKAIERMFSPGKTGMVLLKNPV